MATKQPPSIQELMGDPNAELHPVLKACIQDGPLGKMIHHPLVVELFLAPEMHDMINKRFEHKKLHIERSIKKEKWSAALWMYERPYRLEYFESLDDDHDISDKDYWSIMADLLMDTENRWQSNEIIRELLDRRPGNAFKMMEANERHVLDELPDEVTVYRGCQEVLDTWPHHNREGMSWTLDKEKAEWFAKRFQRKHSIVLTGVCQKDDIIAILLGRSEEEVLIDPDDVEVTDERIV